MSIILEHGSHLQLQLGTVPSAAVPWQWATILVNGAGATLTVDSIAAAVESVLSTMHGSGAWDGGSSGDLPAIRKQLTAVFAKVWSS